MGHGFAEETFLHKKLCPNNEILHKNRQLTRRRKRNTQQINRTFCALKMEVAETMLKPKGCSFEGSKATCNVVTEKREICRKTRIYHLKTNETLHSEPKLHPTFQRVTRQDLSQSIKSWPKTLGIQNSEAAIEDESGAWGREGGRPTIDGGDAEWNYLG